MSEFGAYHPFVNLIFFVFVIGFSCFFMHPVCLGISFVCAVLYICVQKGTKAAASNALHLLPLMLATAIINPVFNHEGVTVLMYLPGGNPLTLQSVVYGFGAAAMLACVISWFSCFNGVMTSDKLMYLFGRAAPSFSLIISMTLRFVPRFSAQLKEVANAQRCMGRDVAGGTVIHRAKSGLGIISAITTWSLENAVTTADSMKSRGYGIPGRTAFSIYKFSKRDIFATAYILLTGVYTFAGGLTGALGCSYFPYFKAAGTGVYEISVFTAYALLCIFPVATEIREVKRWKAIQSKI